MRHPKLQSELSFLNSSGLWSKPYTLEWKQHRCFLQSKIKTKLSRENWEIAFFTPVAVDLRLRSTIGQLMLVTKSKKLAPILPPNLMNLIVCNGDIFQNSWPQQNGHVAPRDLGQGSYPAADPCRWDTIQADNMTSQDLFHRFLQFSIVFQKCVSYSWSHILVEHDEHGNQEFFGVPCWGSGGPSSDRDCVASWNGPSLSRGPWSFFALRPPGNGTGCFGGQKTQTWNSRSKSRDDVLSYVFLIYVDNT